MPDLSSHFIESALLEEVNLFLADELIDLPPSPGARQP